MKSLASFLVLALAAAPAVAQTPPAAPTAPDTLARVVPIAGVEVSTARAAAGTPVARSVLDRAAIARLNWGQDTPMALAALPGAYAYSDAGNGVGYSYLSIRGFPQRRISVLVDGVPLNDPESHEVYWIDHPDLLASAAEVQVQRGVGSALYGSASLGGSVNLEIAPFSDQPAASAVVSYGSWETKRLMLEMNSGRLAGGWNFYGRYSRVESFGYRDQSWSRLWSYALSARRVAGAQSFRVSAFGGPEETHLAYLGITAGEMNGLVTGDRDRDRRDNPLTYPGERDHFFEPHYELVHTWAPGPRLTLTQTLFWFDGRGYYDERRVNDALADYRLPSWATYEHGLFGADSLLYYRDANGDGVLDRDAQGRVTLDRFDLVRRRIVVDRHFGWIPRARIAIPGGALTVGGEIRAHDGRHYGEVAAGQGLPPGTPPDARYYDYHPRTLAAGLFARVETRLAPALLLTSDLGWRHESYAMRDDRFDRVAFDRRYDFAVPRAGLTWTPRQAWTAFASWSGSRREPAFRDLYDGEGVPATPNFAVVGGVTDYSRPLVRPERVSDWELGAGWQGRGAAADLNLFRMDFDDELVYAGQFNQDLGYPVTGNAARSVHQGVEVALRGERALASRLTLAVEGNASLSDNHFVRYTEFDPTGDSTLVEALDYDGRTIGLFPSVIAAGGTTLASGGASLGAAAHYTGRIYLDNSGSTTASLGPHTTLDLTASYRRPVGGAFAALTVRVLNALDDHYAAGGYAYRYAYATYSAYIPAATRSYVAELRLDF